MKPLNLAPLKKALTSLESAIAQSKNEFVRDSVVQRFEYTYELAWKFMKRHLEQDEGNENVDQLTRKDLFRMAAEKGLIQSVEAWFGFHDARNQTSHTYNETKAEEVYEVACLFPAHVHELIGQLEKKS